MEKLRKEVGKIDSYLVPRELVNRLVGHMVDHMDDTREDWELLDLVEKELLEKEKGRNIMAEKEIKEIHINFAKGLVSEPFTGKDGKEYVKIKIPNSDREDKSPWASFVKPANKVHFDEEAKDKRKSAYIYLPEEGETTIKKDRYTGESADGKKEWQHENIKVSNRELKEMLENDPQISISFAKGLVSEPFKGKDGTDYVKIKVPNKDREDKSLWASFVQPAGRVHQSDSDKGVYIYLPENGTTTLRKDTFIGENADGKKEYSHDSIKVSNKELKEMLESSEQIHINFAQGLVSEPFMGKDGKEYVEIKVPNADREDKTPWASFAVPSGKVHVNEHSQAEKKGVYIYLPENGSTTLRKDIPLGENAEGKKEYGHETTKVPNIKLKEMLETYKQKESVLDKLDAKKDAAEQAAKEAPQKEKETPASVR